MWIANWAEAERGRLSLFLSVAMIAGDLAYFALDQEPPLWLGAGAVLLAGLCVYVLRHNLVGRGLALLLLAAGLGFTAGQFAAWRAPPEAALPRRAAVITGTVSLVEALPEGRRVTLSQPMFGGAEPLARHVRVRLRRDDQANVGTGDLISVRALVRPPAPPAYPGAWDLQRDAWFNDVAGYGYALGPIAILSSQPGGDIAYLRAQIAERVMSVLPGAEGAISAVLLTGLPAAIPEADRAAFRASGLAHLLAIAGLHIGIVMALTMGLVRRLLGLSERIALFWPVKQMAGLAALLAGGSYALLTGLHVPILRSFAMASLVVLGLLVGRRALSLRGLALAAAVIVAVAPEEVVGVSFQMSFSAVLVLIAGYAALRPVLRRLHGAEWWRRIVSHIMALALTSLLAGTASAPFAAYHFGQIQLYFIFANILAVPLTAFLVMPLGMLSLLLMPFGLDRWVLLGMGQGVRLVLWVAHTVSAWPAATVSVPHMPQWGLLFVALGMVWLCFCRSPPRFAGLPLLMLGVVSPALITQADILVSSDARVIAFRSDAGAVLQIQPGADRFVQEAFAQYWGIRGFSGLSNCADGSCLLRTKALGPAALLLRSASREIDCESAVIVISAEPLAELCPDRPRIDRFTVWREGAQAVWLQPLRILSDKTWRGRRPWVALPGERHDAIDLPMAQVE